MNNLVNEFRKSRDGFIQIVDNFPEEGRELVLFDKWSLKELLSHLSGWAEYQAKPLKQLKERGEVEVSKNLKASINRDFVSRREKWTWDTVYREFSGLSEKLIKEYESLPRELWEECLNKDKKTTVEDFIKIEINHYSKTHGPQIKKVLKSL